MGEWAQPSGGLALDPELDDDVLVVFGGKLRRVAGAMDATEHRAAREDLFARDTQSSVSGANRDHVAFAVNGVRAVVEEGELHRAGMRAATRRSPPIGAIGRPIVAFGSSDPHPFGRAFTLRTAWISIAGV